MKSSLLKLIIFSLAVVGLAGCEGNKQQETIQNSSADEAIPPGPPQGVVNGASAAK